MIIIMISNACIQKDGSSEGQPGLSTAAETPQDNPRTQLDHC